MISAGICLAMIFSKIVMAFTRVRDGMLRRHL
jgi:hypothetical protein